MSANKQLNFSHYSDEFKNYWKESGRKVHGGSHSKGKRKTARPFNSKKPIHIVMRSSRAKGSLSLKSFGRQILIKQYIELYAKNFDVSLYKLSVNSNHLHLLVRTKKHENLKKFLKTIAGVTARFVMKAKKGFPKGRFWDELAFTRIAEWGRAYKNLKKYVIQNILEAAGAIAYQPRKPNRLMG